jgi:hypothetical protein
VGAVYFGVWKNCWKVMKVGMQHWHEKKTCSMCKIAGINCGDMWPLHQEEGIRKSWTKTECTQVTRKWLPFARLPCCSFNYNAIKKRGKPQTTYGSVCNCLRNLFHYLFFFLPYRVHYGQCLKYFITRSPLVKSSVGMKCLSPTYFKYVYIILCFLSVCCRYFR